MISRGNTETISNIVLILLEYNCDKYLVINCNLLPTLTFLEFTYTHTHIHTQQGNFFFVFLLLLIYLLQLTAASGAPRDTRIQYTQIMRHITAAI